ncbi:MAG: hypothetical protein Kow0059_09860 [Candidatus Sumerlaeia bacterium]
MGLIFSAPDDFPLFRKMMESLKKAHVPYDYHAAAAYRDPAGVQQWAQFAEWRNLRVLIVAAGREPILPWLAAEATMLPVIALPMGRGGRETFDSLHDKPAVPVAFAPPDDWQLALQMALRILALRSPHARAIVGAIRNNRTSQLDGLISDMIAKNADVLQQKPPAPIAEVGISTSAVSPVDDEKAVRPETTDKERLDALPPTGDSRQRSERRESEPEPSAGQAEPEKKPEGEQSAKPQEAPGRGVGRCRPAQTSVAQALDDDFTAYMKVFKQEISKVRLEVQHARNPMQKQLEDEARQAAGSPRGGRRIAPLRGIRDSGPWRGLVNVNPDQPEFEAVEAAAEHLVGGGLVAIPTDTVYGVAADATNPDAVRRLFELKGRNADKAIPLLIHSVKMLEEIVPVVSEDVRRLIKAFWPGPLTLVVPRHPGAFAGASSDETIGVRLPDNFVALSVISMVGRPLAVTSANPSGAEPAATGERVAEYFGGALDLILDAGPSPGGPASTVVRVVSEPYEILREGKITRSQLERLLPHKIK